MFQPEWEALPRGDLNRLQDERLRRLWERLGASPFYRGAVPDSRAVRAEPRAALADMPFTTKANLRDAYPLGFLAVPAPAVRRLHASSGTRGKPTVVAYTDEDLAVWADVVARSLAAAGARPGHRLHNAYGYGLFTGGLGLHQGAERLGMTVVPVSGGATRRQVTLIQDLKPDGLSCTPSFALRLADTMADMRVDPAQQSLAYAVLGAEPWTEAMRDRIEARLHVKAVDIYGLSEIVGPGVAIECQEEQHGLHIFEDHFYPEVVDPKSGGACAPGEVGELVLTTLSKEAMPLLRYRTGDLVSLMDADQPCRCGRTHRRMSRVAGRVDDMLIVRGVNVFPSEIERILLSFPMLAPHWRVVLTRSGDGLDVATVFVERHPGPVAEGVTAAVVGRIRAELGLTLQVVVEAPGTLPRSEGKAVRVVDQRANVEGASV
ncbi:MAG: phenylacetate--CoA ligase [Thermaerobacter sp.]|nr:phenylacetate--CoA ligase [Thermaerobacter sp.]